jgi:hypothetical protein
MNSGPSSHFPQPDEDGNYDSPPLAALRRCWDAVLEEEATFEDLELTLQAYADRVQFELDALQQQVASGFSDPKDPIFSRIVEAFGDQLKAVDQCFLEFDEAGKQHMELGLAQAQKANNKLMAACLELNQRVEAMSRLDCPFCGKSTPRGLERCESCSRVLPQAAGDHARSSFSLLQADGLQSGGGGGRPMTANCLELTRAVDQWKQGGLDWDQLGDLLDVLEGRLETHRQGNLSDMQQGDPDGLLGQTDAALTLGLNALDHMRLAWTHDDGSYIEVGLSQFQTASDQLLSIFQQMSPGT